MPPKNSSEGGEAMMSTARLRSHSAWRIWKEEESATATEYAILLLLVVLAALVAISSTGAKVKSCLGTLADYVLRSL